MTATATKDEVGLRRTVLSNGLTVLSEHMPGVRSVALGAWVRAASLNETPEVMGVSHMLEHMVFKGTAKRSAKDLALSLETLGGSLDAYTSREHTSYQARVLDEHVEIAADVIADLVFNPLLRQSDLDLERKVVWSAARVKRTTFLERTTVLFLGDDECCTGTSLISRDG